MDSKIRRIVTGHDSNGKSVLKSDGAPPRITDFVHVPGLVSRLVWATPPVPALPVADDPTPAVRSFVPPPGETRFVVVTLPPDAVFGRPDFDPATARAEHLRAEPGLAETFEPDSPGMHTTPTVDCGIVLEGEIWLELDDGRTVHLRRHDTFVQNGTRHAWRNRGDAPATFAVMLIGADRPPA
jgi:Cupin domain